MNTKADILRGSLLLLALLGFSFWGLRSWYRHSKDEPAVLVLKWILTAGLVGGLLAAVRWFHGGLDNGDPSVAMVVFLVVFFGFGFAILWTPNLVSTLLKPLTSALDGGDEPPEPRPFYSVARAKRKRGKYAEALAEVRAQLARFPTDVEGQMLAAEILAEDMNDLPGAEIAIQRLCAQPGHAPLNLAFALNRLADWHLKYAQDRDAARQALERIVELCPNTEMALAAAQRIAHLASTETLLAARQRPPIPVRPGIENLGLVQDQTELQSAAASPEALAAQYVEHLRQHPLDAEAREKLALIYADHYQRLDLAADQLEQLIQQPQQPAKQVVRWLNLLADLQIRAGCDFGTVAQTLRRIADLYPGSAAAHNAASRLDLLKLELHAKAGARAVKLGTYEQDLGLKQGLPG